MHVLVPRHRAIVRTLFAMSVALASSAFAATSNTSPVAWRTNLPYAPTGGGGPDAFGYTWAVSTDPGGPVFDWIDISTTGTLVTGLADDNSATTVTLPFTFKYYWTDINQFRIGSNGWIGLGSSLPSNIASCFPAIPTGGGAGDSYLAPFMGDLNFTGAGNLGSVRYLVDAPNQRLVISYLNVPYWSATAPGWVGSNTFQVILDAVTRRIKFQYQGLAGFTGAASCIDLVGGIEAPQGNIGLQTFSDAQPPGNRAIEFTYPNPPLIQIIDPTPSALTSAGLGGVFQVAGTAATLSATVTNDGDGATTSAVTATGIVLDSGGNSIYNQPATIPSLAGGASAVVDFPTPPVLAAGHYTFRVTVSGGGDINPGNNQRDVEIVAVPQGTTRFEYVGNETSAASLDWNGTFDGSDGTGLGVLFVPPGGGYVVNSLGFQLTSNVAGTQSKLKLVDNDGPNGTPGTVLGEALAPTGPTGSWIDLPITPVAIDGDGVYVLWIDRGGAFISLSTVAPASRRSIEFFAFGYAAWRTNDSQDIFLRASATFVDPIFANGFE